MANVLLAWELGLNRGHINQLLELARQLTDRGHRVALCLKERPDDLAELPWPVYQTPLPEPSELPVMDTPMLNFGGMLKYRGYENTDLLGRMIDRWLELFRETGADRVVADHAPTALLASHIAGLPAFPLGVGFHNPPDTRPMPAFRWWMPSPPRVRLREAERYVLDSVNTIAARHGAAPFEQLSALLRGQVRLLRTIPELDDYNERPGDERFFGFPLGRGNGPWPGWPRGTGPRILGYLQANYPGVDEVLSTLGRLDVRATFYIGGKTTPAQRRGWQTEHLHISDQPLDLAIGSLECDLGLNYASNAFVAQMMWAGKPLLMMPPLELHLMQAKRIEHHGAGALIDPRWPPERLQQAIDNLYWEDRYRKAATHLQERLRAWPDRETIVSQMVDVIEQEG